MRFPNLSSLVDTGGLLIVGPGLGLLLEGFDSFRNFGFGLLRNFGDVICAALRRLVVNFGSVTSSMITPGVDGRLRL